MEQGFPLSRDQTAAEEWHLYNETPEGPTVLQGSGTAFHHLQATNVSPGKGCLPSQRSRSHKEADRKRKQSWEVERRNSTSAAGPRLQAFSQTRLTLEQDLKSTAHSL